MLAGIDPVDVDHAWLGDGCDVRVGSAPTQHDPRTFGVKDAAKLGVTLAVRNSPWAGANRPSVSSVLGDKTYERLTSALSLFLGIEASIVMRDVCLLNASEARRVKLWGAQSLLEAALGEAPQRETRPRAKQAEVAPAHVIVKKK